VCKQERERERERERGREREKRARQVHIFVLFLCRIVMSSVIGRMVVLASPPIT
jgi:hypothetical protein